MEKRALITGASEGIGRCLARHLADAGYTITGVARNEARLKELIREIGVVHGYLTADLSDPAGVDKVRHELETRHYDLLVNNAGLGIYGAFADTDLQRQQSMMRLNMDALVALSHAFLQTAQKGDAMVNISSTLAFMPMPAAGLYSATKAFVTSFTESLWYEQKKRGIYVMGFCPGVTVTNFHERAGGKKEDFPASMSQTADEAVKNLMKALARRNEPTVISGVKNSLFAGMGKVLGRKGTVSMMGQAAM